MDLKEALQTAIKGEVEGRELYRAAAEKTGDKKAKEIFTMLADEEQKHYDSLVQMAQEYAEGKSISTPDLPAPNIGMKLELESENFYREAAGEAGDQKVKDLFNRLADWENGHFETLRKQVGFFKSYYENKYSFFRF
ncbi:MAG: ferritin family protein [Spirochaetaceae bacterium]